VILDEACHPKCRRGLIGGHGEQQVVDFAGKVGAITRRGNQTNFGIDTDRKDNAATRPRAIADAWNTFAAQEATAFGEVGLQPFQKPWPRFSARNFDGGTAIGIAQTHEGAVQVQRYDQQVSKVGGDGKRFSSYPRHRDARQCHEISEHP
jgi:hypothetical protein